MKKIFILTFLVGVYAVSNAQYQQQEYNKSQGNLYVTSNGQYNNEQARNFDERNYFITRRERNFEIERINREFRMKVHRIRRNPYMRHREKKIAIRIAEDQRARQIQIVNARFENRYYRGY